MKQPKTKRILWEKTLSHNNWEEYKGKLNGKFLFKITKETSIIPTAKHKKVFRKLYILPARCSDIYYGSGTFYGEYNSIKKAKDAAQYLLNNIIFAYENDRKSDEERYKRTYHYFGCV